MAGVISLLIVILLIRAAVGSGGQPSKPERAASEVASVTEPAPAPGDGRNRAGPTGSRSAFRTNAGANGSTCKRGTAFDQADRGKV